MADSVQIAAFEGGQLNVQRIGEKTNEAVLALPLCRLLARVVRIPAERQEDAASFAKPLLQEKSPYPDDDLTVGIETVRESPEGQVVIAAALPESAAEDIGEALDANKINPVRIDALSLGVLRENWATIAGEGAEVRRLIIIREVDDLAMFVMDGDMPVAIRAVSEDSDLRRETMLCLLEAEDFNGERSLSEIVTIGEVQCDGLETFSEGAVRRLEGISFNVQPGEDGETQVRQAVNPSTYSGIAERALEAGTLNALPESWHQMLEETRFKSKLARFLAVAIGIWVLAMAVLFGVPLAYGFMTDHQKALSREHSRRYSEVREMREKVRLVQKYSDHARGALEILKAVSDRLPEGVELSNWNFKREDGVRFSGEAADKSSVYQLKDALLAMRLGGGEGSGEEGDESEDEGEKVFADVLLTGPSATKGGRQKFDIDCRYETEER